MTLHQQPASSHGADSFHKPGFKLHAKILHHLFTIVNSGVITAPLWDEAAKGPTAYPNNAVFVHEFVSDLLSRSFPNLRPAQLQVSQMNLALLPAVQVNSSCSLLCLNACLSDPSSVVGSLPACLLGFTETFCPQNGGSSSCRCVPLEA